MTRHWHEKLDSRGNLWLGLDYADGPVNLLAREVLDELDILVMGIEQTAPTALIIHSLKDKGFIAGADVGEFVGAGDAKAVAERIRRVHGILDRLEALPCPTLALIQGFCLGGGLELSLACRYRVASDEPDTLLGLPEVRLGLFPGYGGTWRSIRTLGALPAMQLMLTGRSLRPKEARRLGLVDRVVPRRQLEATALDLLQKQPAPRRSALTQRLLNHWPLRPLTAGLLERRTAERVKRDHYPAPFALIDHWRHNGANRRALLVSEAKRVAQLLTGNRAQNLIRVFRLQERLKGLGRRAGFVPRRVHLVGAGVMGGDIAAWCALRGQHVTLQDLSQDQLARAMKRAHSLFERRLRDPRRVRDAWDRLIPDPRGEGLARADLVIEAIVEDVDAKRGLLADIEARVDGDTLLATNTSSIRLEALEQGMKRPQRLVGLHFFNPVARMQLVEVVHGRSTGAEALNKGLSFVRAIDRLPLPVRSSPGFLVNRVLMPYLLEAMHLLEEGVPAPAIDRAAEDFGMPMGP
ncbi:MAG: 3-hydroxyacyl-CoA dehydrogenase NAD-binding domain-containing protein, partial [Pseudomonadota bacterium]|nr:3-hydroxyacyl-CoA dehydrogenase NAD-binding domain-containing protein [Pseudomonadota bacterium]